MMDKSKIKNIFWDVDGVLADLNYAYFHFLKGHPNYRERYRDLEWEQLPEELAVWCPLQQALVPQAAQQV